MHPNREQLLGFVLGTLQEESADSLAGHLRECDECEATIAELEGSSDTVIEKLRRKVGPSPYEDESGCQSMLAAIAAFGRDRTQAGGSGISAETSDPDLGSVREYKLLSKLGEGGMGAVYKALHTKLNKVVALKVLPPERTKDEQAVARFEREMRAVGQLEHHNIVRAMDAGEVDGQHFLVMEYVQGADLSQLVKQHGPLPIADACELIRQTALGLDEAHHHKMVHRDIKPSNLILAARRRKPPVVKILDMGLALLSEAHSPDEEGLTSTGQMMGTLDYMAPEQGDDTHAVDIRADIYALGATLYKLLCGDAPFAGKKYDTPIKKLMALATDEPASISERRDHLPPGLAKIVHKMLAKNPHDRFATPAEVVAALTPFATGANLAALLEIETAAGAENAEAIAATGTADSLKSGSVETAPTIDLPSVQQVGVASRATGSASAAMNLSERARAEAVAHHRRPSIKQTISRFPYVIAASLGGIILLGLVTLMFRTKDGTIRVEINDPDIEVAIKGTQIVLKQANQGNDVTLSPGDHTLVVRRGDFEFETDKFTLREGDDVKVRVELLAGQVKVRHEEKLIGQQNVPPPFAVAPFDEMQAKKHQQAWADYLGLPVEKQITLPGGERLTLVLIPPGEFLMGSTADEQAKLLEEAKAANDTYAIGRIPSEGPQHRVRITKPFYLGKYEVTQAQWQSVMGTNPSQFKDNPTNPVEQVSWYDIQPFLAKLNVGASPEKMPFALPTEAQWEYACRAGTTAAYYGGESPEDLREYGWFNSNSGGKTHRVGNLKPNAFGLYDMHGNVTEWCADWFAQEYYTKVPTDDPAGPSGGTDHVIRSGSFHHHPRICRSANRNGSPPGHSIGGLGFRLALVFSDNAASPGKFEPQPAPESSKPLASKTPPTQTAKANIDVNPDTPPEIEARDNQSVPGLVGHWTFDEGEAMIAKDSSGNGRDGTLKNMDATAWVTAESADLPPVPGNRAALRFDGDDDVVTVPYNPALDLDGSFTLAAWIKREPEPALRRYERIVDHNFVDGYALVLMNMKGMKGQTAMHMAGGNGLVYNSGGPSVTDGKWHHIAVVCEGTTLRFYQDGKPIRMGRIKRAQPTSKAPIAFGNNSSTLPGEEGFHGMLDDIRIYNRALSGAEIHALTLGD